jgi:hypothetical protein
MYTYRKPFPAPTKKVEPKKKGKKVVEPVIETPVEEVVDVIETPVTDTIVAEAE